MREPASTGGNIARVKEGGLQAHRTRDRFRGTRGRDGQSGGPWRCLPTPTNDNGTRTHTDHSPMARGTKSAPAKTALSTCSASSCCGGGGWTASHRPKRAKSGTMPHRRHFACCVAATAGRV